MENASKALIIAGSILIAMLVLGVGVFLFATYSEMGSEYERSLEINETMSFNEKFYNFEDRQDITAQEIVSLAQFIINYNDKTPTVPVKVFVTGSATVSGELNTKSITDLMKFIEKNSTEPDGSVIKISTFSCTDIKIDDTPNDTGRVIEIKFRKN